VNLRRRRTRLIALLPVRDDAPYLPGLFANLRGQVDAVVALDDGSSDGSGEILAAEPLVVDLLPEQRDGDSWNDAVNHRRLVEAAWEHAPDWLLGIDADERVERGFRRRAERVFARARRDGVSAYRVAVRELWDDPARFRADGIFGQKSKACLFRALPGAHEFDERELHGHWAPLDHAQGDTFPPADLIIYHLRMLHAADRRARQERYERLDPLRRMQTIGYDYMTQVDGLVLEPLPRGRGYVPVAH